MVFATVAHSDKKDAHLCPPLNFGSLIFFKANLIRGDACIKHSEGCPFKFERIRLKFISMTTCCVLEIGIFQESSPELACGSTS